MSLPIERLEIAGFRGLRDLTLEQPKRINLLVGPNNTGKTSVVEALSFYHNPFDLRTIAGLVATRDVYASIYEGMSWLFPRDGSGKKQPIRIRVPTSKLINEVTASSEDTQEFFVSQATAPEVQSIDNGVAVSIKALSPEKMFEGGFTCWEQRGTIEVSSSAPLVPQGYPIFHARHIGQFSLRLEQPAMQMYSTLSSEQRDSVIEALQMFSQDIEGAEILTPVLNKPRFYLRSKTLGSVPISNYGDGVRRVLSLALGVMGAQNGLLLIDELETAIHYKALREVFPWLVKLAEQNNTQIFATTHSIEAIDAILEASEPDSLCAYHLQRSQDLVRATRYEYDELKFMREESGLDIR